MEEKELAVPHTLFCENRTKLTLTGVTDVGAFDEQNLSIVTACGELTVRGENLQVSKLSLDTGELIAEGQITALMYSDRVRKPGGGFFSKVFS
ncbi:MAG: sporulation protein YabP [Clostridia bacterium]|nr:sporulation protein YabP [Clostridia bacterium]